MKKVGILTYHSAVNYGAFMQAYALCSHLARCYPELSVELINYINPRVRREENIRKIKRFIKFGHKSFCDWLAVEKSITSSYHTLSLSRKYCTGNIEHMIHEISHAYDLVIVGSDAVFNWTIDRIPNIYFFNTNKCPHVTYAASAHLNRYKDTSATEAQYVGEALGRFQYLGVRDEETARFVRHFRPDLATHHNCDPTVLLEFDYKTPYLENKLLDHGISPNDMIICIMLKNPEYARYLKQWFGDEYKLVSVRNYNQYADASILDLTPFEWSKVFGYARLTVTEYFHGTLLSLMNAVPVISIDSSGYNGEYESKAKDLLKTRLNLPEFYYEHDKRNLNSNQLRQKCYNALNTDYTALISEKMARERLYFNGFGNNLEKLLGVERVG